uniref:Uncharacterized protein n=1 Tax=Knipowitschia caucasica TaxID=637954 RepID=A0AAV2LYK8_KNICA
MTVTGCDLRSSRSEHMKRSPNCGFLNMSKDFAEMTTAEYGHMEMKRFAVYFLQCMAPLNLGTPNRGVVCAHVRRAGDHCAGPQLKGTRISASQTLIKAFQPPMAPLIQS